MKHPVDDILKYRNRLLESTEAQGDTTVTNKELEKLFGDIKKLLPKFIATEKYSSQETFNEFKNLLGEYAQGSTIEERITRLIANLDMSKPIADGTDVREISKNLILLETLSHLTSAFNARTIGFMMESMLAAIFGGKQISVDDHGEIPESESVQNIVDVEFGREAYSVKTLKDGGIPIQGSVKLLKYALGIEKSPNHKEYKRGIKFLLIYKHGQTVNPDSLTFYTFDLKKDSPYINYFLGGEKELGKMADVKKEEEDYMKYLKNKMQRAVKPRIGKGIEFTPKELEDIQRFADPKNLAYAKKKFIDNKIVDDFFNAAKKSGLIKEAVEPTLQFRFELHDLRRIGVPLNELGTLKLRGFNIQAEYERYLKAIKDGLTPIYTSLNKYNMSLYKYFGSTKPAQKKDGEQNILASAKAIPTKTKAGLEKIKTVTNTK